MLLKSIGLDKIKLMEGGKRGQWTKEEEEVRREETRGEMRRRGEEGSEVL